MQGMAEQSPKKKVLLAITKSNWGGAQRYVFDLATHLPKDEFNVVVAHGGNGVMAEKLRAAGIRTIEIPELERDVNTLADISSFKSILRVFRVEKPDVLHLNSSKMGFLGALAGRCAGIPRIVFTAHGWPFNEDRPFLQRTVLRLLAHITVLFAHRTIAVSDAVAYALGQRMTVVRNGVAMGTYMQRSEARAALVPQSNVNEFWFGTIAELHQVKGLSFAIGEFRKHAALYPSARYVIIGEGDERKRLEAQIQASGYADRIHLCGFYADASQYLKAFDAFILPSLSEGLSYSLLEAGAARTPVIATRVGGIPEIIENGKSGVLVPTRDSPALATAMELVQNDAPYRESLASALQTRVTHQFSLEGMVKKTLAQYR